MSSPEPSIELENVGPIEHFQLKFKGPGVTILNAPNGSGKSIALNAIQAAAAGKGKAPLRDQTRKGKVEAFGAKITIGKNCRHTGEFEAENLEGRFDIGQLIDPKLKSPEAADSQRIKALVSLTGVKADPALFKEHEAFDDFEQVITESVNETDDLVEMARRVKRDYDNKARELEAVANREDGHVTALDPDPELDLSAESDADALEEAYDSARDHLKGIQTKRESYLNLKEEADTARGTLEAMSVVDTDTLQSEFETLDNEVTAYTDRIAELQDEIKSLEQKLEISTERRKAAAEKVEAARQSQRTKESLEELLKKYDAASCPSSDDLVAAQEAVESTRHAVELGVRVRAAKQSLAKAAEHRSLASEARKKAEKCRDAGKSVDDVLSGAIKCDELRIESDGTSARLVARTDRGDRTPYHELSDGERGRIAIDIAAKSVGKGGIVVVDQLVWEGLDADNRDILHRHAVEKGVYVLTAEASQTHNAPKELNSSYLGDE